ncbi:MAG: DUF4089 domain-containing protein [Richelia sp. RM2_1_2]|nr:DUF4089 domain-containing protein [Richelia sp. SM2_1_7]NJM21396.1 DUF4089 domain-containing protein [Richelia sp. SM1_7_0]NJN12070.1 DUF4089 domain-containing protein [Richelia sp. RM1_1_1]NJO30442.1 DUF4089 domain-containing protein [Richelia sp. SL_2_1]NJO62986.1 DUF4089 domain-containing protein [Richelia sp. RM2_1_2]
MKNQKFNAGEYVDQMALLLDLQLSDEYRDGVIANLEKIQTIAKLVNEFPLPENIQAAPIFKP